MEVASLAFEEPEQLRLRMLVLAAGDPDEARSRLADEIAALLESRLGEDVSPPALSAVSHGYERELWLWLVGERTWAQCGSGLVGRLARRPEAVTA